MKKNIIFAILLAVSIIVMSAAPVMSASSVYKGSDEWTDRIFDEESGTDYTLQNQVKVTNVEFQNGTVKFDMFWKWTGTGTYLGQAVNASGQDQWIENGQTGNDGIFRMSQQATGTLDGKRFSYNLVVVSDGNGDIIVSHQNLSGIAP